MNELTGLSLRETLPYSIAGDLNIQGLSKAAAAQLIDVAEKTELILILPNLSLLPEAVVDQLAWHFSVDFYDITLPREAKEQLLYQSIAWHRRKGTVKVVEEIVTAVHSSAQVIENGQSGGQPYHFKVIVEGEPIEDTATLNTLKQAIDSVKNVRSWLDGIEYKRSLTCDVFYGGATYIHKEVMINV